MSGDWIKMRGNLWDDPRVAAIVDATDSSEAAVVGALYWLWATADQHTEDGVMPGLSVRQIDRKTGLPGFAAAVEAIGWIEVQVAGIRIIRFDEHNGQSAKRRCQDAKRKDGVRNVSAPKADKVRTDSGQVPELEKEIEIEKDIEQEQIKDLVQPSAPRSPFERFWHAYPNKQGKQAAEKTWQKRKLDPLCDDLIVHVALMQAADDGWRRGFIPMGSTYLNQARWEDVPKRPPDSGPPANQQVGKQVQGVMALEERKRELQQRQRLAGDRNPDGLAETFLLVDGSDAGR